MFISAGHEAAQHARPIQPVLWSGGPPVPFVAPTFTQRPALLAFPQDNPDIGPGEAVGLTAAAGLFSGGPPQQARPLITTLEVPTGHPLPFFNIPVQAGPAPTTVVSNLPVFIASARHNDALNLNSTTWLWSGGQPVFVPPPPAPQFRRLFASQVEQPEVVNYSRFTAGYFYVPGPPPPYGGPNITIWAATSIIVNAGLIVGQPVQYVPNATIPRNYVISQTPPAGSSVLPNTPILLTVSLGPAYTQPTLTVPNVIGMNILDAQFMLSQFGFNVLNATFVNSSSVPDTIVMGQSLPGGGQYATQTSITLTVSAGVAPVTYGISYLIVPNATT